MGHLTDSPPSDFPGGTVLYSIAPSPAKQVDERDVVAIEDEKNGSSATSSAVRPVSTLQGNEGMAMKKRSSTLT
jgi:hypothetical protein